MATILDHYRGMRGAMIRFAALEFQLTGTISVDAVRDLAYLDRRIVAEELLEAAR